MSGSEPNNRPSGIPRASRLPILSKRGSQLFVQSAVEDVTVLKGPATQATPRVQKRSSIASIPRSLKDTRHKTENPRSSISNGISSSRPRLSTRTSSAKSSFSAQSSVLGAQDEETVDRLGSLGSFRASSRQSSYDDTDNLPAITANKVRKSRPSLSDRAMESIQAVPTTPKDRRQSNFYQTADSPLMAPPPRPVSVLSNGYTASVGPTTSDGTSVKPVTTVLRMPTSAKPLSRTNGAISNCQSNISLAKKLQSARQTPQQDIIHDKHLPTSGTKVLAAQASSAALRQQIAAAKAAAKREREAKLHDSPRETDDDVTIDHDETDLHADPFNQAPKDDRHVLRNRIRSARLDGKLNISALQLREMPEEIMTMYSSASIEDSKISWAELVDLTKFVAADNEFHSISNDVFPDLSPDDLQRDEQSQDGQFGGIELLDLHNNILTSVPIGLRRLERLTVLNLTHNKLENTSIDTIAQIKSLKDLRIGHNNLSGTLPSALCTLPALEVLDLQANRLLALPEAIRELTCLRVLNASSNQLTSLPMDAIAQLPLHELDASSNALIASLFPLGGISQHNTIRRLKLANNSLAALTFSPELAMPELEELDVSNNHLAVLPSLKEWQKLTVLYAGDNKLAEFPDGFTTLQQLRIASLGGNDLHTLPPHIALMDSLTTLVLASNPLRHKKYLTMGAADIKQDLRSLLTQTPDDYDDEVASWGTAPEDPTFVSGWSLKAGGLLDLSNKGLTDSINDTLGSYLEANDVRQLHLQGNKLTILPPALWLGQGLRTLDLSNNPLDADYLSDDLELPALVELALANCRVNQLDPLLEHLRAPALHILQVNGNRIAGDVPDLHQIYPSLITLLAADNKFDTVSADALRGYSTVDLTSNELQNLPAEIGLLWEEGLKSFEVGRNAFRVPGHRVLEKGTQATMRWLRDRIKSNNDESIDGVQY